MKDSTKGRMAKRNKELSYIDWCIKEPKPEKNVRYIKQVTDDKGRLTNKSKVITWDGVWDGVAILQDRRAFTPDKFQSNYWKTFNFPLFFMFVGMIIGFIILALTIK